MLKLLYGFIEKRTLRQIATKEVVTALDSVWSCGTWYCKPLSIPLFPALDEGVRSADETIILFHSLLNGCFAAAHPQKGAQEAVALGERWQDTILDLCDQRFFFVEMEDVDIANIDAMGSHWPTLLIPTSPDPDVSPNPSTKHTAITNSQFAKLRAIAKLYNQGLEGMATSDQRRAWDVLFAEADAFCNGWLSHASQLMALKQVGHEKLNHCVVTTGQLIPTLAKLSLFHLSRFVDIENVYCARTVTKDACFKRIKERFPTSTRFLVIGDSSEEELAAQQYGWPFLRIQLTREGGGVGPLTALSVEQMLDILANPQEG